MYWYLFKSFLSIGSVSFGGYMSLVAMVRTKLVVKDSLIDDNVITEGTALATLLPGPLAVNVVGYIGYVVGGVKGAILSIMAVLIPSFFLILGLSWLYFEYQSRSDFSMLLGGVIPVVAAIVISTGTLMAKKSCQSHWQWILLAISFVILFFLNSYVVILFLFFISALVGLWMARPYVNGFKLKLASVKFKWLLLWPIVLVFLIKYLPSINDYLSLAVVFSSASLTMFGGGYVMVPMLNDLLVHKLVWLNQQDFSAGIAMGQVTPGPILISAAFFGYKIKGALGAVLATLAIFLPSSFLMIFISHSYSSVRDNAWLKACMKGILPVVVGLILFSGVYLLMGMLKDHGWLGVFSIFIIAFILIYYFNFKPPLVIIVGVVLSYLISYLLH